jgi:hypothetical protein
MIARDGRTYAYQEQLSTWDAKYLDASDTQPQSYCDTFPGLCRPLNILLRALIGVSSRRRGESVSQHPTPHGIPRFHELSIASYPVSRSFDTI